MNEITIPYHLAVPTIICLVGLVAVLIFGKRLCNKNKPLWISVIVFLAFYLLIVGGATYDDIYYQWDLNRYDLNKDGLFSGEEITQELQGAAERLTNDVGRNFSFITGFVFAFILSIIAYLLLQLFAKIKKPLSDKK